MTHPPTPAAGCGELDELERLAKALGGIQDWRLVTDTDDAKRIGPYVVRRSVGAVAAVPRESPITSGAQAYMAFIAAANPQTVLSLIAALRQGREYLTGIWDVSERMNPDQTFNSAGRLARCAEYARAALSPSLKEDEK